MRKAVLAAALLGLAALPASASAHATMARDGDTLVFLSRDAISQNTLTVILTEDRVRYRDTTVDGGIDPGTACDPGEVDANGYIIEVICRRAGTARLRIDVADREDSVTVREAVGVAPLPTIIAGGVGADTLVGGVGADDVDSGPGEDVVDGRAGDDLIRGRDGVRDRLVCGDGNDRVEADDLDEVDASCEVVDRAAATPGGGDSPAPGDDTAPPVVEGGALTLQRIGGARALRVLATSSEPAELAASATVMVGGQRLAFRPARARVTVSGAGATLRLRLSRADRRIVQRALARRRRLSAVVTVVATDAAGNSSATRLPVIRLTR